MKAIVGRKMGMTQVFAEDGTMYPVTVIEVLPNVVTQVKTLEKMVMKPSKSDMKKRKNIALTKPN